MGLETKTEKLTEQICLQQADKMNIDKLTFLGERQKQRKKLFFTIRNFVQSEFSLISSFQQGVAAFISI